MQLVVYCNNITPRVDYIFSTLLDAIGIGSYSITADEQEYLDVAAAAKINYSTKRIATNEIWVNPAQLLFQSSVEQQQIDVFYFDGLKAFYKTLGDIPFDLFAASFYLITRYEEYLPHKLDMYGRYSHENSLAFREGFLNVPLVNLWLKRFRNVLTARFPGLHLQNGTFSFLPTYDIDIVWSYRNKGLIRNTGGFIRSIAQRDFTALKGRFEVLAKGRPDPFDAYDWLDRLHNERTLEPIYFFLVAEKNKGYDKNILPSNPKFQHLIREHGKKYKVGLHPSWQSGDDEKLLRSELTTLERLSDTKIDKSRQHYIRFSLPETYRKLIAAGIKEDYSMGYGSINGFRASYCLPYKWYDLEKEESTELTIFPFCYMDANSYYEQHYSTKQALQEIERYYRIVKDVNGLLITIWHNHFLGSDKMFRGWKEVYWTATERITGR